MKRKKLNAMLALLKFLVLLAIFIHGQSSSSASELVSGQNPSASMAPANAHGTRQSAKLQRLRQRDDREVSLAAIAPSRPCHSMAWSGGI